MIKNLLLYQFLDKSIQEIVPTFDNENSDTKYLSRDKDGDICWLSLDTSLNIIVDNKFKDTIIYYSNDNRIGVGRFPLFTYKIDIAVPKNTMMTAFHIGDGSFGFSMGNGTTQGFIPEIIGIGSDENDTGLYFVGIAGNDIGSNVPLIIVDGRSYHNNPLKNRPIFGITSSNYNEYKLLVKQNGDLELSGDIILENLSLKARIARLEEDVNYLKTKI